ncbi:hypothetical protein [Algoriphagus aquimarinus]|uniref:Uncharacterized protein n=1 Tax=Algoriphagus aquimarinus TaxID=237018 RepID=A0A1I1C4F5_9BACT|nr:hypothetical protein [Algoriphagus aquimarinus]SFB55353.1 hypothetical protein SAMN04489723_11984 [Algoriphagus aquimarinus]
MNNELKVLYTEVSPMANWLKENFKIKTKHLRLVNYMAANPLIYLIRDASVAIPACLTGLNLSEEYLQVLLEDVKKVFAYNCKIEDDLHPLITKASNEGLMIPKMITQFYWDEFNNSNVVQFQGNLSFQTGEIINLKMFPDYIPTNAYYVKDKVTQFNEDVVIIGYVLAVWDFVPIED